MKKSVSLTLLLLVFHVALMAQKRRQVEYSGFFDSYYYRGPLNITLGAGTAGYIGDLGFMPGVKISPAYNVGASYKVWPRTYFGLDFNYLTLGGIKNDTSGSISFSTTVYELTAYCRFNLLDKRILFKNDINKRPQRIRPYLTLGVGAAYFDPKIAVSDTNFFKTYQGTKTTNVALVLPVSLGFAFYLNKRFSILTEFGYRYIFTDALDGIKKTGTAGMDSYATASLKIQYTILPFKKKRAKYVPPIEGSGSNGSSSGGNNAAPVKKDSTLNDPILPPGAPEPAKDSSATPGSGTGDGQITPPATAPPADEKPKELTDEEKRKIQEEKEQLEWENSSKPKPAAPADKKKKATPKPKPAETGGW